MDEQTHKPRRWTREELLGALVLYAKLPFGQFTNTNLDVIRVATVLDRSPSSVSMKLCNFASLEPAYQSQGIKGLQNASELDRTVFGEYSAALDRTLADSQIAERVHELVSTKHTRTPNEGALQQTEGIREASYRKGQSLFRDAVLSAYGSKCAVSGIADPRLLNASHIVPWRVDAEQRLDPRNGIALSSLHDRAFDLGLMSFDDDFNILISSQLEDVRESHILRTALLVLRGERLTLPDRFHPNPKVIRWHRENIYLV